MATRLRRRAAFVALALAAAGCGSSDSDAAARQLNGRPARPERGGRAGEVWGAESGADRLVVVGAPR